MEAFKTILIASLVVMTSVVASALVCIQPVFAQTDGGFAAPEISTGRLGSPTVPDLGESSHLTPPSLAGPALAPAPQEPVDPQWAPMPGGLIPERSGSPIEPWVDPAVPATSPMLTVPPGSMAGPGGGFYAPVR